MSRRKLVYAAVLMLLCTPLALAAPPHTPGLPRACDVSGNANPCGDKGDGGNGGPKEIPDTIVGPGDEETWEGDWTQTGTVVIFGTATVSNGEISQEPTSGGWVVMPGGSLTITNVRLYESINGSDYGIVAHPESGLTLDLVEVQGGSGVQVATSDVSMSGSRLRDIDVALRLFDVTAVIEGNHFLDNNVAVNQTGGAPTLMNNVFDGGEFCVRDWRSDPTIVFNVFRGCHVGIYHEESESTLSWNTMSDQAYPPGTGIWIINTNSPTIEGNDITNFGTGIRITNARAYIRENTIHGNVGHGIAIETNTGPMDIHANTIFGNGGDGIRLVNVLDVPVTNNVVRHNGGDGIAIYDTPAQHIAGNVVHDNAGTGIALHNAPDARLEAN
ncbi:MAG TPA: right-handed parallel beta-helix repeat-containing protein, partial [Candidatus Thermoplasmatota archaeon]|nr:right-handed parallel beta-helix repeat-containing protein [Candidatus Thermoplasmatota archaeon]